MRTDPPGMVGLPSMESMFVQTVEAMYQMPLPPGSGVMFERGSSTIAAKRNRLAERFLAHKQWQWLLFLDTDMVPPPFTLKRLLSHQLPIVGPLMFTRQPPFMAEAVRTLPDGSNRTLVEFGGDQPLERVAWMGAGCLLIRREALVKIPRPWFGFDGTTGEAGCNEDEYFCQKATKAGISIHCDTGFCVGHLGVTSVDLEHVMAWEHTSGGRGMLQQAGQLPAPA